MASATDFIDVASANFYLEEKWSQICTIEMMKKLVFADNIDRQFEAELKRGQKLWIGAITQPTARAKSENIAITYETVTETGTSISIDTFYYTAIALEDVVQPMVSLNMVEKYLPGLSYGLALQEDTDVGALVDTLTNNVGTMATDLTYDNLVRADQYLNDYNVPEDNRFIVISPAQKAGFLKLDQFIHRDYADLRNGLIGSFLGTYPIFSTTNTEGSNSAGHDNFMGHKECIAQIQQIKPYVRTWWDGDYQCVKMTALATWGQVLRRDYHGVWLKGS